MACLVLHGVSLPSQHRDGSKTAEFGEAVNLVLRSETVVTWCLQRGLFTWLILCLLLLLLLCVLFLQALYGDIPRVRTPKIYWQATKRRVLTMEWIEGVKLTNKVGWWWWWPSLHFTSTHLKAELGTLGASLLRSRE